MTKETTINEPNRFSKSVGAGMKSVLGSKGRSYFVLEHLDSSKKHKKGESQEIIIDHIEIGRDPKCQVVFAEDFPTVSRRHASITREGDKWVLKQLSEKNPTLVNGKPIAKSWFLQSGDEIKFSYEGPSVRFFVPGNNTVGTLGFTKRLNLFRKQALRPYKAAMSILAAVFVLAFLGLGYFIRQQSKVIETQNTMLSDLKTVTEQQAAELIEQNRKNEELVSSLKEKIRTIESVQVEQSSRLASTQADVSVEAIYPSVFYLYCQGISIRMPDGTEYSADDFGWSGTGFLLDDGRLVTARHVVEPWYYPSSSEDPSLGINAMIQMGAVLDYTLVAVSPGGAAYNLRGDSFRINKSKDQTVTLSDGNVVKLAPLPDDSDWAYATTNLRGTLQIDNQLAGSLQTQSELHILGYPLSLGATNPDDISPLYSTTRVARTGLHDGLIYTTDRNFDHGNSGGPVMYYQNGSYKVVGIVSAGTGDAVGFIVPVSALY